MHGDVDFATDAVLTQDDYVQYDRNHPFFRSVLQGDLISKTFLFIGFSFEDPNLDSVIRQIKLLLDENVRNHYCFMKRVARSDANSDEEYGCQKARQDLREQDMKRYGIQTVFVDEYSEITELLRMVENAIRINNVFISGSADFYDGIWTKSKIDELAYKLANRFVQEELRVTSGFGVGIGSSVINGALDEIYSSKFKHIDEHLCLRPFPQGITDPDERKEKWKRYREDILDEAGVVVFMIGNKKNAEGKKAIADGCLQEYDLAKERKCLIIPIGSTGDAAATICEDVKTHKDQYPYIEKYLDILSTQTDIDIIINAIMDIIQSQRTVK